MCPEAPRERKQQHNLRRYWCFIAEQAAPAPHLAHPEGCVALHIVLITAPHISRSCEHFEGGHNLRTHGGWGRFNKPLFSLLSMQTLELSDTQSVNLTNEPASYNKLPAVRPRSPGGCLIPEPSPTCIKFDEVSNTAGYEGFFGT